MTDAEFVKEIIEAESEYDSDFLAWKVTEIVDAYLKDRT